MRFLKQVAMTGIVRRGEITNVIKQEENSNSGYRNSNHDMWSSGLCEIH